MRLFNTFLSFFLNFYILIFYSCDKPILVFTKKGALKRGRQLQDSDTRVEQIQPAETSNYNDINSILDQDPSFDIMGDQKSNDEVKNFPEIEDDLGNDIDIPPSVLAYGDYKNEDDDNKDKIDSNDIKPQLDVRQQENTQGLLKSLCISQLGSECNYFIRALVVGLNLGAKMSDNTLKEFLACLKQDSADECNSYETGQDVSASKLKCGWCPLTETSDAAKMFGSGLCLSTSLVGLGACGIFTSVILTNLVPIYNQANTSVKFSDQATCLQHLESPDQCLSEAKLKCGYCPLDPRYGWAKKDSIFCFPNNLLELRDPVDNKTICQQLELPKTTKEKDKEHSEAPITTIIDNILSGLESGEEYSEPITTSSPPATTDKKNDGKTSSALILSIVPVLVILLINFSILVS